MQKLEYLRISRNLKDHANRFHSKLARWNEYRENHPLRKECIAHALRYLEALKMKLGHLTHMPRSESSELEIKNCQSIRAKLEIQIAQLRAFDSA